MGLVQRELEAAKLSTITLSPIADFTASVGAPRVAAIEHPNGLTLGRPGDNEGQRAALKATLDALKTIENPGEVVHLPFEWPEANRSLRSKPAQPPPIVKAIMRKPWLLARLISGRIPE